MESLYFMRYLRTILPLATDLEGMGSTLRFGYLVAGHGKMREEEITYLVLICSQCATQTRHSASYKALLCCSDRSSPKVRMYSISF